MGLKIIIIKNNIIINNIDKIKVDGNLFYESKYPKQNVKDYNEIDEEVSLYKASDYFFKAPRFRNNPDKISINVDPAPQKQKEDDTPFIYTIGPMLTMGMTSRRKKNANKKCNESTKRGIVRKLSTSRRIKKSYTI